MDSIPIYAAGYMLENKWYHYAKKKRKKCVCLSTVNEGILNSR